MGNLKVPNDLHNFLSSPPPASLSLSLKHLSWNERSGWCPAPRQGAIPALWFLGASGSALWYRGEAAVLCRPPGTPPSVLAPNFALSSAESKILIGLSCGSCSVWKDSLRELQAASQTPRWFQVTGQSRQLPVSRWFQVSSCKTPWFKKHHLKPYDLMDPAWNCIHLFPTCASRYLLVRSGLKTNKIP